MKPRYDGRENVVLAHCPDCDANTSFDTRGFSNTNLGTTILNGQHVYNGEGYSRILWHAFRCTVCSRGAIAKIHDNGNSQGAVLEDFIPRAVEKAGLPASVPDDIIKEFREAELDAAYGAYRSASAMLRSTLEKTLIKNGYDEVEVRNKEGQIATDRNGNPVSSSKLIARIDAAAWDRVITEVRQKRAHDNIRVLGNDVLHEDWREITEDEYNDAHKYTQRILEDFYDDRPTIEARLSALNRSFQPV